ncbi:MAG: hypothetical protein U0Y10_17990 [Spirosomataceae bacterium]
MTKNKLLIGLLLLCAGFWWACSSSEPTPADAGYGYFPLQKGQFVEYDVTETVYSLTGATSTSVFQLKEVIGDSFADLSGQTSYRVERYRRANAVASWQLDSVWTAKQVTDQLIKTENNIPYVKLTFPVRRGQKWNGNVYNALGKDDYEMDAADKNYSYNGQQYEAVLTVIQQNDSTLVSQNKRIERFAQGIGLIYKENTVLFLCAQAGCVGQGKIDYGVKRIQTIKTYGKQ